VTLLDWYTDRSSRGLHGKDLLQSSGHHTRPNLIMVLVAGVGSRRCS